MPIGRDFHKNEQPYVSKESLYKEFIRKGYTEEDAKKEASYWYNIMIFRARTEYNKWCEIKKHEITIEHEIEYIQDEMPGGKKRTTRMASDSEVDDV